MLIEQIRPFPTTEELAELYRFPNDADNWPEHRTRVDVTIAVARGRFPKARTVIDPAAGATARTAIELGELVTTNDYARSGLTAEEVLVDIGRQVEAGVRFRADLIILGEILEHVADPAELLGLARDVANGLVLSTPLEEPAGVNPEHVWRWDKAGIIHLLTAADWNPADYVELDVDLPHWPPGFRCQIHTAEAGR